MKSIGQEMLRFRRTEDKKIQGIDVVESIIHFSADLLLRT